MGIPSQKIWVPKPDFSKGMYYLRGCANLGSTVPYLQLFFFDKSIEFDQIVLQISLFLFDFGFFDFQCGHFVIVILFIFFQSRSGAVVISTEFDSINFFIFWNDGNNSWTWLRSWKKYKNRKEVQKSKKSAKIGKKCRYRKKYMAEREKDQNGNFDKKVQKGSA